MEKSQNIGTKSAFIPILFGCTFLVNETTESFIQLFETFFTTMGGKQPISIFTDQDQAIANEIKKVFPKSRH